MRNFLHILKIFLIFATWIGWSSYQPIRGKSIAPSTSLMIDNTKKIDKMAKKKTLSELKDMFKSVWGDRFIYDHITEDNYVNTNTKVLVECREHGIFEITPSHHLHGVGCRKCQYEKLHKTPLYANRKKIFGVGVFDVNYSCNLNDYIKKVSKTWRGMLMRCYDKSSLCKRPSYNGCSVCEEWLYFSNFKTWFDENYVEGYALDKDILFKGNKLYSPNTCCFVPQEINSLLVSRKNGRGMYPLGVRKGCGEFKYSVVFSVNGKSVYVGTFNIIEDAFRAYKTAKEQYIKDIATKYFNEGKITESVYNALMNYKVEITD